MALDEKEILKKSKPSRLPLHGPRSIHQLAAQATKMFLLPNHSNPTGESTLILETPGDKLGS